MLKDLRAHFRGCLLGSAIGDALGGPLEFMDARAIEKKHGYVTEMLGGGWLNLKIGEYTDDTQMALCLAQSLVERDEFSADDIAARFVAWLESNPPDVGNHTRAVLSKIAAGADWKSASNGVQRQTPQSAGNGSLMRCAPVALWDFAEVSKRLEHSRVQSEITHAHQECQWSCALLNSLIFHLMSVGVRDVALDRALAECRDAPGHIRKRLQLAPGKMKSELKPSGYVLDTLDCAVWAFINSENFEDALVSAVNLGGDADTVGAVCGALAGAFYGERDIPARWLEALQNREILAGLATKMAMRQLEKIQNEETHVAATPKFEAPDAPNQNAVAQNAVAESSENEASEPEIADAKMENRAVESENNERAAPESEIANAEIATSGKSTSDGEKPGIEYSISNEHGAKPSETNGGGSSANDETAA